MSLQKTYFQSEAAKKLDVDSGQALSIMAPNHTEQLNYENMVNKAVTVFEKLTGLTISEHHKKPLLNPTM